MDKAILDAVASGAYIMGKPVKELEAQLAEYVGVKHCLTCANGTDALTLALKAWGIGPGDAVFVPDFTFFSSAEVVPLEGATPVFVDVREETFNIDAADLQRAVEQVLAEGNLRPRVVVAVDLFGLPADYKAIRQIADKYGLFILEDGAQGFGGSIEGKRACGVRTTQGTVYADHVVWNGNPNIAFANMVPKGVIPERELKLANARKFSARMFVVYIGLNRTAEQTLTLSLPTNSSVP